MKRYLSILEKWKTEYVKDKDGKSKPKRKKDDDKEKLVDDDVEESGCKDKKKKESFTVGASRVNNYLSGRDKSKILKLKRTEDIADWLIMSLEDSDVTILDLEEWLNLNKPELSNSDIAYIVKSVNRVLR